MRNACARLDEAATIRALEMTDPQNEGEPWQCHIEETFKGLIALSIELLKALLLINGGAAVAILAYLGNLASHASPVAHLPNMRYALLYFAGGVFATALAFIAAYFTQYRLYFEERARHTGRSFNARLRRWLLERCVGILNNPVGVVSMSHFFASSGRTTRHRFFADFVESEADATRYVKIPLLSDATRHFAHSLSKKTVALKALAGGWASR
jgi:hypothetical protein